MSSVLFCDCEKLLCTEVKQITQGHRADEWKLGPDPGLWTAGLTYGLQCSTQLQAGLLLPTALSKSRLF